MLAVRGGAVAAACRLLRWSPARRYTAQYGCELLRRVCCPLPRGADGDAASNMAAVLEHRRAAGELVEAVVAVLRAHVRRAAPDTLCAHAVADAMMALVSLVHSTPRNAERAAAADVMPLLACAMAEHPAKIWVQGHALDAILCTTVVCAGGVARGRRGGHSAARRARHGGVRDEAWTSRSLQAMC